MSESTGRLRDACRALLDATLAETDKMVPDSRAAMLLDLHANLGRALETARDLAEVDGELARHREARS
jgi:hypothetical protein